MPHSSKSRVAVILIVLALAVFGAYWFRGSVPNLENPHNLRTGKVFRETLLQRVSIAGRVEPIRSTLIPAPYEGYIKKVFVKIGEEVKAGDPLVSIAQSLQASENVFPMRAPFAGTITQVNKTEGQATKPGDTKEAILRLDDLTIMYVNAEAPEIDLLKIQSGFEAQVKVSAVSSRNYRGRVREIAQAASLGDNWGRGQVQFLVRIELEDADRQLRPGMSAIVDIVTSKRENALVLPLEFVQREGEQYFVTTKSGQRRSIKVGFQNETSFEVLEGLVEGEEVRQVDFLSLIEPKP